MTHESSTLEDLGRLVDDALDRMLPASDVPPTRLHEAMRYSVFPGGKRLRPVMTLASCYAVGGETTAATWPAAAVELVHCFSLIHDDLPCMDDDDFRRGKPSCHKAFGEAVAVLAGDALLTLAFQVLADPEFLSRVGAVRAARATHTLAAAAGSLGIAGGQAMDLDSTFSDTSETSATRDRLDTLVELKTGRLFDAAVRMGAIAGGAGDADIEALSEFARDFGFAFQVLDDLADSKGRDQELGRLNYASLLGQDRATSLFYELISRARLGLRPFGARAGLLLAAVDLVANRRE
ncbi:MAG: polyprenyl synthetase family protein [Firmicutes bacterium]|jgi:geranylgeranyl diphosphate synthase type II|nr:polyprenyl synthetase family protein [Bacillota bacterium]